MNLKNKVVFLTGGSSGIGLATAKKLLLEGAKVTIYSLEIPKDEEIKKIAANENALIIKGDICKAQEVAKAVSATLSKFQKIDILINNAAVAQRKKFIQTTKKDWDFLIDVNIKGTLTVTKEVLKEMIANPKGGMIINIASGAGVLGIGELSLYSLTKAALINFSQSLSQELSDYGIKVLAITPGSTDTQMFRKLFGERKAFHSAEEVAEVIIKSIKEEIKPDERLIIDVFHHTR
ncbi:MAG: SDR family oxidoreductase [Patescibacteria group bacterium]|nr:SDR family oxidoreductase [Patescibacteria group bacterium]